jgi:diaminopimelate epimerase
VIVPFVKMSGAGNDMVLIDHRARFLEAREARFARAVCERRWGVGADGVILLEEDSETDFYVRFFNPDGGEYELCGNGARCVPRFATELGFQGPVFRFRSPAGVHEATMTGAESARIRLAPVRDLRLGIAVEGVERVASLDWGDIGGVPHACAWVEDVSSVPVARLGAVLRNHPAFAPLGTNVSFAERTGPDALAIRTFERGVEGETFACGSGSAVVATIARARGLVGGRVRLRVRSGESLTVTLPSDPGGSPELEGPVWRSFEGVLDLERLLSRRVGESVVKA